MANFKVGCHRKQGAANYGSDGALCEFEVEYDPSIPPEELENMIAWHQEMCRDMVANDLAAQAKGAPAAHPPAPQQQNQYQDPQHPQQAQPAYQGAPQGQYQQPPSQQYQQPQQGVYQPRGGQQASVARQNTPPPPWNGQPPNAPRELLSWAASTGRQQDVYRWADAEGFKGLKWKEWPQGAHLACYKILTGT